MKEMRRQTIGQTNQTSKSRGEIERNHRENKPKHHSAGLEEYQRNNRDSVSAFKKPPKAP